MATSITLNPVAKLEPIGDWCGPVNFRASCLGNGCFRVCLQGLVREFSSGGPEDDGGGGSISWRYESESGDYDKDSTVGFSSACTCGDYAGIKYAERLFTESSSFSQTDRTDYNSEGFGLLYQFATTKISNKTLFISGEETPTQTCFRFTKQERKVKNADGTIGALEIDVDSTSTECFTPTSSISCDPAPDLSGYDDDSFFSCETTGTRENCLGSTSSGRYEWRQNETFSPASSGVLKTTFSQSVSFSISDVLRKPILTAPVAGTEEQASADGDGATNVSIIISGCGPANTSESYTFVFITTCSPNECNPDEEAADCPEFSSASVQLNYGSDGKAPEQTLPFPDAPIDCTVSLFCTFRTPTTNETPETVSPPGGDLSDPCNWSEDDSEEGPTDAELFPALGCPPSGDFPGNAISPLFTDLPLIQSRLFAYFPEGSSRLWAARLRLAVENRFFPGQNYQLSALKITRNLGYTLIETRSIAGTTTTTRTRTFTLTNERLAPVDASGSLDFEDANWATFPFVIMDSADLLLDPIEPDPQEEEDDADEEEDDDDEPLNLLQITRQPQFAASGQLFAVQPRVAIRAPNGSSTNSTANVTVEIASGEGGQLFGTLTVAADAGTATFTDLALTGGEGETYTLRFTSPGSIPVTSNPSTLRTQRGILVANLATRSRVFFAVPVVTGEFTFTVRAAVVRNGEELSATETAYTTTGTLNAKGLNATEVIDYAPPTKLDSILITVSTLTGTPDQTAPPVRGLILIKRRRGAVGFLQFDHSTIEEASRFFGTMEYAQTTTVAAALPEPPPPDPEDEEEEPEPDEPPPCPYPLCGVAIDPENPSANPNAPTLIDFEQTQHWRLPYSDRRAAGPRSRRTWQFISGSGSGNGKTWTDEISVIDSPPLIGIFNQTISGFTNPDSQTATSRTITETNEDERALLAVFGRALVTAAPTYGGRITNIEPLTSATATATDSQDRLWRVGDPVILQPASGTSMQVAQLRAIPIAPEE